MHRNGAACPSPALFQYIFFRARRRTDPRQIHEPILALSGSEALGPDCRACYAWLAGAGVPINLVVPYDDVPGQRTLRPLWSYVCGHPCCQLRAGLCRRPWPRAPGRRPGIRSVGGFLARPNAARPPVGLPTRSAPAEGTYTWLVELPVAAISLDFLGVPGVSCI